MAEIQIEPGAAKKLAESVEDDDFSDWLQDNADGDEMFSMRISENTHGRFVARAVIADARAQLDEIEDDYKRGKLEGKIEMAKMFLDQTEEIIWKDG